MCKSRMIKVLKPCINLFVCRAFRILIVFEFLLVVNGDLKKILVDESTAVGAIIDHLPSINDEYKYELYQAGDPDGLALYSINKKGEVLLKSQLNYEIDKVNFHTINVIKRKKNDNYGGLVYTRQIHIIDSNNHSPKFAKKIYHGHIVEGLPAGSIIKGLEDCYATDLDSSGISDYTITAGNNNNEFMLAVQELKSIKLLIVKTTTILDRDRIRTTPYLDLEVQANDGGVGSSQKFDKTVIRIKIEDINDNPPVFIYNNWHRSIQESSVITSPVMKISASDNDEGQNAEVYYRFEGLVDNFFIHPSTGVIGVAFPLDSKEESSHELTVIAQDKSATNPKSAKAFVTLQIIDIPGYPTQYLDIIVSPSFLQKSFTVTIRADLPEMSFVFLAVLEKKIMYNGNSLTFTMIGAHSRYFHISTKTGVVTLKQALNRLVNTKETYKLYISVEDSSKATDTSILSVNVQPLNLNINPPIFSQSTVSIEISEDINVNTEIGYSVSAVDADGGDDGQVYYQIVGGSGIGYFHVDRITGVLTTKVRFKNIGVYDLYIRAMDDGLYKKYSVMYARIRILYGFDTPPMIYSAMYKFYFPENSKAGSFVGIIYAKSPVPGREISYKIDATERMRGISVHKVTGVITTTQTLDYEQESEIFLDVSIQVQGSNQQYKTAILIDIINDNDNPPVFTRSSVTVHIAENSGELDSIVCLFATDEDGIKDYPISYSIFSGNIDNSFSINSTTGQLAVKNLDYENHKSYNLVVVATDGESTAKAIVNVIVTDTDDPPHFDRREYNVIVDENTKKGTVVKEIPVTSEVGSSHICSWNYDDVIPIVLNFFELITRPESCVIKVKFNGHIKLEKGDDVLAFFIRAVNKKKLNQYSTTKIKVKFRDVIVHKPVFSQESYALSIIGEQQLGKSVIKVSAVDTDNGENDRKITYDIQDGIDSGLFSIQPSGEIFIKSALNTMKEYVLRVNARKQGPAQIYVTTKVRISVLVENTELPKFAYIPPVIKIIETAAISSIILTVNTGTANTDYEIVGGNKDGTFSIERSGKITLNHELDYETIKSYELVVRATLHTVPPKHVEKKVNINVLDVNDNSPVFAVEDPSKEISLFVDRYSPKGTIIGKFKAYDLDGGENGIVSYTIPGSVPFSVGKDGTVTTTRGIDDPIGSQFQVNIIAMDNSKSTSRKSSLKVKVLIKKGRKPPLFSQQVYRASLSDNLPIGTAVTTISTTDINPMSTATFKVSSGNLRDFFCIDATQILSLIKPLDLDQIDYNKQLKISVEMSHDHQSTLASIFINLEDVNDNYPAFIGPDSLEIEVKEDSKVGHVFHRLSATDIDYEENGSITYSITQVFGKGKAKNKFKIDDVYGEISINEALNYEEAEKYIIIVKAQDNGSKFKRYTLKKIIVKVVDVNDKIPHFTESTYVGYIPTNANPGYHIIKVYAVDFDSGRFGQVKYSIIGSDYSGTFTIGETSGIITLLKSIALLEVKSFQLNLIARDIDKGGQVVVNLFAVTMEGPPSFALRKFTFNVSENNDPSKQLGKVMGISLDSLRYTIVRGNIENIFKIDSRTGIIYSIKKLDAETSVRYILYIRATDFSKRFVETSVEINVLNVNDHSPEFKSENGMIEVYIQRIASVQSHVANVQAYDKDVNDRLTFAILPAIARAYFKIDKSGSIKIIRSIRSLSIDSNQFEFKVIATDFEGASGKVKIRLTLVQFLSESIITRDISELRKPTDGWFVTSLPRQYPSTKYEIVFPDKHPFIIDQTSGYIGLKETVDYEAVKYFVIIIEEKNLNKRRQYINYKVRIQILDYNDNEPFFTMQNIFGKVNKNAQPGTTVFKITANDLDSGNNGAIVFEIKTLEVPFDIDPITSEIKTTSLVTLTQNWYNITVQAYDRGRPSQVSNLIVIRIKTGDNPPEFSQQVYEFKVRENSQAGKQIGVILARSLSGISIQYSIESGDEDNLFIIKSDGSIILQGDLDYESGKNLYKLIIQATEMSTQPLISRVRVIIEVINVNDNPPVFKEQEYRSQPISENVPIGTTVLTVSANDCDCGQTCHCAGGDLTYVLQKYTDSFRIDDITGEIKTIKELDYDIINEYRFQVKVYDTNLHPQTGVADVVITLLNVNDNAPKFKPNSGTYPITEFIARGTILLTVQAQDLDGDQITYAIDEGDKMNFEIGAKSGVVQITAKTNPIFIHDTYKLKISASDGINKGYYMLTVEIEDVNDNNPIFTQCSRYNPSVAEQASVGTIVIKVTAQDTDRGRNGEVEYEIREPQRVKAQASSLSDFKIDNTTGVITTNMIFDREIKNRYILLVIALDGGHSRSPAERNSASCQLEIVINDINDHKPIFSVPSHDISISETDPIGKEVLKVSAHDEDQGKNSEIDYSIKQGELTPQFEIDRQTGSITVAMELIGKQTLYSFQVVATDKGFHPQSSNIEIDIHVTPSNPPRFEKSIYKKWITEDVPPGTLILTVSAFSQTKQNQNKIFYSILPGNLPSTNKPPSFNVDSKTGEIRTGVKLDYETLKEYVLTLNAVDELGMKSNTKVFIYVEDRNDNSPNFMLSKYEFGKIAEGKSPGQIVEIVNATDADSGLNALIKYHLQPSRESDMFIINEDSGEIRTKVIFDREITPRVTFHVRAEDQAAPPELRLSSFVYVTIQVTDINDNPPGFTSTYYNKTVEENTAMESNVLEIKAEDKDAGENSRLNYYIISGNEKGYFGTTSIHRASGGSIGYITIARKLDREDESKFTLKVAASDSKYNAFTIVYIAVIDSNDNDPKFTKSLYNASIAEDAQSGRFVLRVHATDLDTAAVQQPIRYSIASGADGFFVIDGAFGDIQTGNKPFDREKKSVYTFLVFASDGTRTGSANVRVLITDVNDEMPEFLDGPYVRQVQENQKAGEVVGYVTAKDKDEGKNRLITYSLSVDVGRFTIHSNTGLIRTKVVLDRESNDNEFEIVVAATDGGEPSLQGTVKVKILVTDANDMHPYFIEDIIVANIDECTYIGDVVTKVKAKDNDLNINAEVMFAITSGNTPRRFRIDPDTGIITVAHRLDYEKEKIYHLEVSVRDKGVPQLISKKNATVVVNLNDCNDNIPFCEKSNYIVYVLENATTNFVIHSIVAFDHDTGNNGKLDFFIDKASENYQFKIKLNNLIENSADIILDWELDREAQSEHYLQVGVQDRGVPQKTGTCQVLVKVLDVNDNPPRFEPQVTCGIVIEEEKSGESQTSMTVKVVDADGPGNQCPCIFEIVDNSSSFFEIEALPFGNKAVIRSKRGVIFDREERNKQIYELKIAVTDSGFPPLTSETTVFVEVKDKNDNAPQSGGELDVILNIYGKKFIGGNITPVYILDDDRIINNIYTHSIISRQSDEFNIDQLGVVSAKKDIQEGKYNMEISSTDRTRGVTVNSYVYMNVRNILDTSVKCAVPIRFSGMRKKMTCREINFPDFEIILSSIFQFDSNHSVEIFSIKAVNAMSQIIDVWFYISNVNRIKNRLVHTCIPHDNTVVLVYKHWKEIERRVGAKILSVGIDACAKESCPANKCYCYNQIKVLKTYSVFTNENGMVPPPRSIRAFVSLDLDVTAQCKATAIPRVNMDACDTLLNKNPCFNGGTCVSVKPIGYRCQCPKQYEGPQCQRLCRTIRNDGYFWLPKMTSFCKGSIAFEFATNKLDGLLLYHGPITIFDRMNILDFLAVDLINGQIRIHVTNGESKVFVKTMTRGEQLNDGMFHHVEIFKRGTYIRVTVDYCNKGRAYYDIPGNRSVILTVNKACQISGTIPGVKRFLNGDYPLQVGSALHPHNSYSFAKFEGNIRNIIENDNIYDLQNPTKEYNTEAGCDYKEICKEKNPETCSKRGHCYDKSTMRCQGCICPFGYTGSTCSEKIPTYNLQETSYFSFVFKKTLTWYDRFTTNLKIQLKTKNDGILYYEGGKKQRSDINEFVLLQIVNNNLLYLHNLGDGVLSIDVPDLNVANGKWYDIHLQRKGATVQLEVLEKGKPLAFVTKTIGRKELLDTNGIIYIGAQIDDIKDDRIKIIAKTRKGFAGCLKFSQLYCVQLFKPSDLVKINAINAEKNCSCDNAPVKCATNFKATCEDGEMICQSIPTTEKRIGGAQKLTQMGGVVFILFLLLFFLFIIIGSVLKTRVVKPVLEEQIWYDGEGKDNIMPYEDDGAGEDDFFNYDLEKMLRHVSETTHEEVSFRGISNTGYSVTDTCISEMAAVQESDIKPKSEIIQSCGLNESNSNGVIHSGESVNIEVHGGLSILYDKQKPTFYRNTIKDETLSESEYKGSDFRYQRGQVETLDVALFIETKLVDADNEYSGLTKDTLLHYGYEGEGSDVEDLSELDESDNSDIDDFSYIIDFGPEFSKLHGFLNYKVDSLT